MGFCEAVIHTRVHVYIDARLTFGFAGMEGLIYKDLTFVALNRLDYFSDTNSGELKQSNTNLSF